MPDTRSDPTDSSQLHALSPLDGRYGAKVAALRALCSESAFMRFRVQVEVEWLIALSDAGLPELESFSPAARTRFRPRPVLPARSLSKRESQLEPGLRRFDLQAYGMAWVASSQCLTGWSPNWRVARRRGRAPLQR